MISLSVLKDLLLSSSLYLQELKDTYSFIPETSCKRKAECCSLMPEMTLLEAMSTIKWLSNLTSAARLKLLKNIVYYFFMNPVEITSCPFLKGRDCRLYENRFLGCRSYGLLSREYYEKLSERSRQAKISIRKQWEKLGIYLPAAVMDFQVPYCSNVKIKNNMNIDDESLLNISNKIDLLSQNLAQWHRMFRQIYFSDLSFLVASLIYGFPESIRLKFIIVSDVLKTENRGKLDKTLSEVYDIFS